MGLRFPDHCLKEGSKLLSTTVAEESWLCGQGHHWATQLCDYQCSDGRWVATGAVSPKQWLAFCNAIARDDLGEKYAPVATRAKEYLACKEEMIGESSNGRLLVLPL